MEQKKRTRRGFGAIILQKFDAKAKSLDQRKYEQFRVKLEGFLSQFENLLVESKKAKRADKRRLKSLAKFTKEELEDYLKSLK